MEILTQVIDDTQTLVRRLEAVFDARPERVDEMLNHLQGVLESSQDLDHHLQLMRTIFPVHLNLTPEQFWSLPPEQESPEEPFEECRPFPNAWN